MNLGSCVSSVFEVVGTFVWHEGCEGLTDCGPVGVDGWCGGFAQQVLEFGEYLLDRVQVGRIFRQKEELCANRADECPHDFTFVAAEIVHDDDVTGLQGREQNLLDVNCEALTVDRAIENPWGLDPIVAQCGQEGCGLPMAVRDFGCEPGAARRPAPQGGHVGLGPGLIDEDQTLRINLALILLPLRAPAGDVRTDAFAGDYAFFCSLDSLRGRTPTPIDSRPSARARRVRRQARASGSPLPWCAPATNHGAFPKSSSACARPSGLAQRCRSLGSAEPKEWPC